MDAPLLKAGIKITLYTLTSI